VIFSKLPARTNLPVVPDDPVLVGYIKELVKTTREFERKGFKSP
jgi:hypothetical protein